jgi:23S rRNA pseudouridine955/2504/2580 synthase
MTDRNKSTGPRLVTVDAESAERRLDNFLISELGGLPRSRVYSMIRTGEVRVNKGRAKAGTRLSEGDVVRVPPVHGLDSARPQRLSSKDASWLTKRIIYEDKHLLVLDKPAGLAVHGGSGISMGAIEMLRAAREDCHYLELVHRLDRDTSGCLLFARKRSALRFLHEQFRTGGVRKIYHALLKGTWSGHPKREVSLPLVTEHRRNGERHVRTGADGKTALTRFTLEQQFNACALARVELMTGRTHQIRVHAAAIGHPLAGDERYGESGFRPAGLSRLFLHASRLGVRHPDDGRVVEFNVPLDPQLQKVLDRLGSVQDAI